MTDQPSTCSHTCLASSARFVLMAPSGAFVFTAGQQYKFTLHWLMYAAIGNAAALLCTTLVLPVPAGMADGFGVDAWV